ncbi:aspartate kinase [Negadavirga shengliensis]|uniref:Aspartokinase n=1 Tax=Negadavirga shengliensis TaxID=1389218 RepID=A0ABV9T653_9BACT
MIQPLIFKFGGASIKDADAIKNIAHLVKNRWSNGLVIVISAAGDTTDTLEKIIQLASEGKNYTPEWTRLLGYHLEICNDLFEKQHGIFERVTNHFSILKRTLDTASFKNDAGYFYDQAVGFGELISTRIVQELLCAEGFYCLWQDARELVATDSSHKMARVDWALTMQQCRRIVIPKLEKYPVITQGFIGQDLLGNTTTLGREGSDFTAAILAVSLGAKSVTIWKDVEGILNGDPDLFPDAVKFDHLDFEEAAEMTYYGAKVIHPKTIKPLAKHRIPLFVKSFLKPDAPGTVIGPFPDDPKLPITVVKNRQLLLTLRIRDLSMVGGFHFEYLYSGMKKLKWNINLLAASASNIKVVADAVAYDENLVQKTFRDIFHVTLKKELTLITVKNYREEHYQTYVHPNRQVWLEQKSENLLQVVLEESQVP